MSRNKYLYLVPVLAVILIGFWRVPKTYSQNAAGGNVLQGIVKSSDGKPMEGVTVSIRGVGKTYTTSVFTQADGTFLSPRLEKNKYRIWAQAVGFEPAQTDVQISDQPAKVNLEVAPMTDFHKQLSGAEYVYSLPETDPGDRRMKEIFVRTCTDCHPVSYPLQNRFDQKGWGIIINQMSFGGYPREGATPNAMMLAYKDELAAFLAKVRGPDSAPLVPKPFARPTGEAARAVITEYDLPRPADPESLLRHDGTDWAEGTPSRWLGRGQHDVAIDKAGMVWFSDDTVPDRTLGKLDPLTGKVTAYKMADKDGNAVSTHSVVIAQDGMLWVTNQTEGGVSMFDPETEKFTRFPKPDYIPRAGQRANAIDLKGNVWIQLVGGVAKLEPKTGKYTFIASGQPTTDTYGLTVDKDNNIWFSSPGYDTVWMIDQKNNNKVTTLTVPPLKVSLANDRDRELSSTVRHSEAGSTPIQKGPRRMTADPNGNYLWIAEYFSDQLLRIDIHTKEMKEYDLPYRFSQPYTTNVDREHNVWINMLDRDAVAKFNPTTEQFTEIQMPTRGTEIRQTAPDDSTNPVSIWVPYDRTTKIARIQIRSSSEMQAPLH